MGFKKATEVNEEKHRGKLILPNDGDYIDVVFLYRSKDDVLVGPTHYIKGADYNGYVHCLEGGCPACARDIRVQSKMFIPCWVPATGEIIFWDRNEAFFSVLDSTVFNSYPNPSEYVFRITRRGEARSRDTKYEIVASFRNNVSFDDMLKSAGAKINADGILDAYDQICKEVDASIMNQYLNQPAEALPTYTATPRVPIGAPSAVQSLDSVADMSDVLAADTEELDEDVNFD